MNNFPEDDWKHFKKIQAMALDRLCARVLKQLQQNCTATTGTNFERFEKALSLAKEGRNDYKRAFTDLRRSTAFMNLLQIEALGLISDEELKGFSARTRAKLAEIHEGTPNIG
jgi:hypothetical protein